MNETCVVVGGGQAGGRAVEALRGNGYEGRVVLVGAEPHLPYERPPLSKDLLVDPAPERWRPIHDAAYYAEAAIETELGTAVVEIDVEARRVRLADGRGVAWDRLLLCTGANVRRLDLPGATLAGVHYLRTLDESRAIGAALAPGANVVIIGGGFIGLEVAASARKRGCAVTVVEAADRLMGRAVPAAIGSRFLDLHRSHGVDVRLGTGVAAFEGEGSVAGVRLAGGETLAADVVVIGVGVVPATALAASAGIAVDDGILTDEHCRTSVEGVFACGDASRHFSPRLRRHLRLESWHNAQQQAVAAARNLAGIPTAYEDVPWFWTDQYDVNLQMLGVPPDWDDLVARGTGGEDGLTLFRLIDGELAGAISLNRPRDMAVAKRLMAARKPVDASALADASADLRRLLR